MVMEIKTHHVPTILLVEDTPSQAIPFKMRMEDRGCQVTWVATGHAGIEAAHQHKFDLIVLDIELPDINGFQVCRALKADPTVSETPVIMLTTHDRADEAMAGIEHGALDYIPKDPFAELVLLETLRQMGLLER